jgi:hypothetical protein
MSPRTVLLAVALFIAGCLPQSKNPIAPRAQTFADPRLEGLWEQNDDREHSYFHMGRRTERGTPWLDVVDVDHRADGKGLHAAGYTALCARVGEHTFLSFRNLKLDSKPASSGTYAFARYDFTWSGDLRIWLASEDALASAIRAGRLHGTVRGSGWSREVTLTDSSTRLAEFFAAREVDQFFSSKPMTLHRVRR